MSANKTTEYRNAARILGAISSESAFKIMLILGGRGKFCVSEVSRKIGLSLSATSHQLRKLEAAGLIYPNKKGRSVCYFLKKSSFMKSLISCLKHLLFLARKL